jgi:plastocyanin
MKNIEYVPKAVTAKVGQTIHWTNGDSVAHTVTSKGGAQFDSGTLDPGSDFSFKVTKAGTINYACQIHPNQTGTIVVS